MENREILATDDGEINIYGQIERLMTDAKYRDGTSKTTRYLNGNNNSVYATSETTMGWYGPEESIKEIKYTDSGYTDDIRSGFGYNGEVLDDSGLIYLRARYYNPQIGQFVQIDENRGDRRQKRRHCISPLQ